MSLVLTEDQESIRATAKKLVRERAPIAQLRAIRDRRLAGDTETCSRELWSEMAALGFAGMTIAEAHGGAGLGLAEIGLVLEECGRNLVASPLFATLLLGGAAIARGGSDAQRAAWLPRIARGEAVVTLAHEEGTRHAPHVVATRAERDGDGFVLRGEKTMVVDGGSADAFVVVARTSGGGRDGLTLLLVPRVACDVRRRETIDARDVATVRFDGIRVAASVVVGVVDRGADVLDPVLDRAAIALSAEMLGGAIEAFERTIAYLKVRKQFGVPIGSFQALKHRAAQMFCEIELTRALVLEALRAADAERDDVPSLASATKARASDLYVHVANEAVQMHGGIGVTDELDIGLFLKRARVCEMTLGAAAFHRERFARLAGY